MYTKSVYGFAVIMLITILFVNDLPLVSALNAYGIVNLCVCLYSVTHYVV